ncbi:TonB-dependent receptor [Phenylobacterium sp.]|uniref:TonB-dependent receptor n=1 Tax=Phenylobacterium sp. TaxID=1871053 RepID=UPI002F42BAFA
MIDTMIGRRAAWCGASLAAMLAGAPALAQPAATPAASRASDLEEVVVTARRREERLQDVPVAVTAFTPERLRDAQVTTARQLVGMVPSLNISSGNQRDFQRYAIRGQGATVGSNEGVTVYFADAPLSQYVSGGPGLYFDLQNLQVLNGPQGTLFGRNTTGGAVLFSPQRPTNQNEGFIQAGVGNYNNRELSGVVNFAPLPDVLKIRLGADSRKRDGFTRNLSDGADLDNINYYTLRAGVLFTPSDKFENSLVANFTRSSTRGTGIIVTDVNPTGPAQRTFGLALLQSQLANQQALGVRITQGTAEHWWYTKTLIAVNTSTLQLPYSLTFKNIASFSRSRASGGFDNDGTTAPITQWIRSPYHGNTSGVGESRNEYLTEEAQLSGKWLDGKLDWVVGGYYQNTYPYGLQTIQGISLGTLTITESHLNSTTSAAFGQATLDFGTFSQVLSGLKLTGGYRYTWDTRHYSSTAWRETPGRPCSTINNAFFPNCLIRLDGTWKAPTYTLGLDYKVTPDILVYGTMRSGYKSGGFNVNANPLIPSSFGPEKVTDHEIGVKADFHLAGMPLRTNLAAFKDDYLDIQRSVFRDNPIPGGGILTFLSNASSAKIKGFEAQVTARPVEGLQVDFNYSHLDATYGKYLFLDARTNAITDIAGTRLPFTPKNKYGVSVKYRLPVDESLGDPSVSAAVSYQGAFRTTDQIQPGDTLGDYTLVNLGAAWNRVGGSPVDAEFFMTNVLDKKAKAASQIFYYAIGVSAASYIEPRMFGVRLRYNFGG